MRRWAFGVETWVVDRWDRGETLVGRPKRWKI